MNWQVWVDQLVINQSKSPQHILLMRYKTDIWNKWMVKISFKRTKLAPLYKCSLLPPLLCYNFIMAKEIALGFILIVVLVVSISQSRLVNGTPQVPCFFIFGDSLADNGNNNHLKTPAKANYLPYGIDFPKGPTGRFTNGRTFVDIIGIFL